MGTQASILFNNDRETFHRNEQTYHLTKRTGNFSRNYSKVRRLPFQERRHPPSSRRRPHLKAIQSPANDFISNLAEWICNEQWVELLPSFPRSYTHRHTTRKLINTNRLYYHSSSPGNRMRRVNLFTLRLKDSKFRFGSERIVRNYLKAARVLVTHVQNLTAILCLVLHDMLTNRSGTTPRARLWDETRMRN